jgi:hypothetical protein
MAHTHRTLPAPLFWALVATNLLILSSSALADRKWNNANDPRNFDPSFTTQFNKLIPHTRGDATVDINGQPNGKGWSDSYWPLNRGYIADRWQNPDAKFKFKSYALPLGGPERLKALSITELNLLSPAEKFDILRGRYDLPLAKQLIKDTEPKEKSWWKGLCDGWTTAALHIAEPQPVTFVSKKDKIEVPLGSSDIKGLLSFYYARRHDANVAYVGKSCRANKKLMLGIDGSCQDINAGAFHVVLINQIGLKRQGFAMDRDGGVQVWNQPVLKYQTEYTPLIRRSAKASEEARKEIAVKTTITYANELYDTDNEELENDVHASPSYEPVLGTSRQRYKTKTYEYVIELDAHDQIIGGDWTGGDASPDMIWKQDFSLPGMGSNDKGEPDDWSVLRDIVKHATHFGAAAI